MTPGVVVEERGRALWITLNRPEQRNALDWDAWEILSDAWNRLVDDPSLWVGVIRGSGDRSFCAGADLKTLPTQIAERRAAGDENPLPPMAFVDRFCPKPVVASLNGDALGGGLELALACDLRVTADHARFGLPEVRWGALSGAGGTQRLPRLVPLSAAFEMLLTGGFVNAAEAFRIGLVNRVVPAGELDAATEELVSRLLAVGPLAIRNVKTAVLQGLDRGLDDGIAIEREKLAELMQTKDYGVGIASFATGRPPEWTGE